MADLKSIRNNASIQAS